jgi:hypothetical protein
MLFDRFFKGNQNRSPKAPDPLNQGVFYFYLIIGMQVFLVFGILLAIMLIGKVIATPVWVFVALFMLAMVGFVYIYRKAKRQLRKFSEVLQRVDPSGRNYEISVMGGMLTMRVEQNPRRLLEAGPNSEPVIDAQTIESLQPANGTPSRQSPPSED